MATTYPRKNENGDTVWACCESSIGPVCNHLRCPEEWTDLLGDEEHHCTLTMNHSGLCVCKCGHNKKGQWVAVCLYPSIEDPAQFGNIYE